VVEVGLGRRLHGHRVRRRREVEEVRMVDGHGRSTHAPAGRTTVILDQLAGEQERDHTHCYT
jgi:hypothetical protein